MNKNILALLMIFNLLAMPAFCGVVAGGVSKDGMSSFNKIIDSKTKAPIGQAKIIMPQKNYRTYSDDDGNFNLDPTITNDTVMSVEKEGYRPYSVTVNQNTLAHPLILGIEKSTPKDVTIETDMLHLGDNNFSDLSANSKEFKVKAIGPYYSKTFKLRSPQPNSAMNLIIGSIIGVDTQMAKSLGQNKVVSSYASPPEVYFNGSKIAEIQVNGDGQKIKIPNSLIKSNQINEVTIKTGRNLTQTAYVDYDDIEFMNLSIEAK